MKILGDLIFISLLRKRNDDKKCNRTIRQQIDLWPAIKIILFLRILIFILFFHRTQLIV